MKVALCFGRFNNIAVHPCYLGTSQQFNQVYSPHRLEDQGNVKEKLVFLPTEFMIYVGLFYP